MTLVASPVVIRRAARLQLLVGELADRLQHSEPWLGRLAQGLHQTLVHQLRDQIQGIEVALRIGNLLDRLEVGAADEDRYPGEQQFGVARQQRVAPGDGVAKRPLPRREVPRPLPQEFQALISHPF